MNRTSGERLARAIDFRSGSVIAVSRLVLATTFFLALWIDPDQPARSSTFGYPLLLGYLIVAVALVIVAARSWWWDHRLAWVTLAIDLAVFLAAVYFTEGKSDFTSPFLAFFAFVLLATTIRWDWRLTAIVALVTTMLYLSVGLGMTAAGIDFDQYRFGRRVIYMIILSLVLVWFGLQRRERHVDRFHDDQGGEGGSAQMLDAAMAYAMAQCRAPLAVVAWSDDKEPWVELRSSGLTLPVTRLSPEQIDPSTRCAIPVRLFNSVSRRQLRATGGGRPLAVAGVADEPLARMLGIEEALALPINGSTGRGEMLLVGIRGPSMDHVEIGERLVREIEAEFDRLATATLVRTAAIATTRDAVARDLHDSVAQALAGASFRIEALRNWIRQGKDPEPEIAAIKQALRSEQRHVRGLIARLRSGGEPGGDTDLIAALSDLSIDLGNQWGLAVTVLPSDSTVTVPGWLAHEVQQIAREAVANGVRHGAAKNMTFAASTNDDGIGLIVTDDGNGFPMDRTDVKPWSLFERVKSLGGSMALSSNDHGARIEILLPLENAP